MNDSDDVLSTMDTLMEIIVTGERWFFVYLVYGVKFAIYMYV